MTAYFYDLEFLDTGKGIEIISIGMVADDGREYYAVNRDAPWDKIRVHPWLMDNVVPHLPGVVAQLLAGQVTARSHPVIKARWQIAREVSDFIRAGGEDRDSNKLIAYFSAYDHVALCQLWGPMINLPPWVPMHTIDLKPMADGLAEVGFPAERPDNGAEHDALADARWNERYWRAQVAATSAFLASLSEIPEGMIAMKAPTAARLIERMLSEGPNEGISPAEEKDLRAWWETYIYPPGEPEAGDGGEEEVTDEQWAALEAQQGAEDDAQEPTYAHNAECNTLHDGPAACPPPVGGAAL